MRDIILVFSDKTFENDGSFDLTTTETPIRARVIDLQPSDIQRLQEGGITINQGISISVIGELEKVPDYVKLEVDEIFRVVSYTFREGVSVMIVDTLQGVLR